jgi:pimeloyl-ACP methyl ester carboxylesterase
LRKRPFSQRAARKRVDLLFPQSNIDRISYWIRLELSFAGRAQMNVPTRNRRVKVIRNGAAIIVAAVVVSGIGYEQVGRWRDRKRYAQIGRSVDIGGRTLNIFCSGEGYPTVIFDSGGHTAGYSWISIQPQVAKFTRACWYDRAGYGWSDPGPRPRTSRAVVNDLQALLHAAAIPSPYVLVGATPAFHVRVYNGLHPADVAGVVLIDPTSPDAFAYEPQFMKGPMESRPPYVKTVECMVVKPAMLRLGLYRLFWKLRGPRRLGATNLTPDQQAELHFLSDTPLAQTGAEGCDVDESMAEVRASGNFGNRPLIVLTSENPFEAPSPAEAKATEAYNEIWVHKLQPQIAGLSTRGRQVVVKNGNFGIQYEAPGAVIDAIRMVVTEIREERGKTARQP